MKLQFKVFIISISIFLLIGCGDGSSSSDSKKELCSERISITKNNQVNNLAECKNLKLSVDMNGNNKSLYLLLTNEDKSNSNNIMITHNLKKIKNLKSINYISDNRVNILYAPKYVQEFNSNIIDLLKKDNNQKKSKKFVITKRLNKSEGDKKTFYLDKYSSGPKTDAILRKVVSNVSTEFGNKTLNIWVSDDAFGYGCAKKKCVTQDMVDTLADHFLKDGDDNDIYDWDTNIFGEEWGAKANKKNNKFIDETNEITILLTDIDNDDSPSGGTMGYFWAKDNLKQLYLSGSNEEIMFYADSVMYANEDNGDFWQKEMYSTLAHEFQHMIHFYQKAVLLDAVDDTWINEMLSETTEDLVATKIKHTGPRGVSYTDGSAGSSGNTKGRYPEFNKVGINRSLTQWQGDTADYSKVSSFGTFLTRNYGGAKVLHDIVYNNKEHEDAVMYGVHKYAGAEDKTFSDVLQEWGVAVILSDKDNLQDLPTYNTGDFTYDTYKNSTYKLGSINFFNYDPKPDIKTSSGSVEPESNYYYKIGDNLTGIIDINITLDSSTKATLIAK